MQCICSVPLATGSLPRFARARTHARLPLRRGCAGMHAASALVCHRRWARMRDCVRVCASASYPQGYAGASSAPLAEAVEREPTDLGPRDEVRELRLGHLPCRWCDDQRLWLALPCLRPHASLVGKHGTRTCGAGAPRFRLWRAYADGEAQRVVQTPHDPTRHRIDRDACGRGARG
jgi:hypothetical protein